MAELDDRVRSLLEGANFAHVATLMPDGAPHSVTVWIGLSDGRPVFFTQSTSRKSRNLDADPRLAISIAGQDDPYRTASIRGRVAQRLTGDAAMEIIDEISRRYTGEPFGIRGPENVVYVVEPEDVAYFELPFEHRPRV